MSATAHIGGMWSTAMERFAEREAIVFRGERWTYRGLGDRVAAGAHIVRSKAGSAPSRVALVGANHPAYVVGYLAAQVLGASTVEVSRDESLAAIQRSLQAAAPDLVLTDRTDLSLPDQRVPVVSFDDFLASCETMAAAGDRKPHAPDRNAGDEASIVFTSGTTGSPKGVVLSHGNVLFVVGAVCDYLELTPSDRYALVLPLSHTYGKSNLLSALAAGAAVVFVEAVQDIGAFFGQISREGCTVLSVVPFHLNIIARRGLPPGCDLRALRAITTSGGPLPASALEAVGRLLPHVRLFCMYGLTESATRSTYLPPEWLAAKPGSVGKPLPGVRLEIRGDDGRLEPTGTAGDVWVRGPNVMTGYLDDAALTAETLVGGWLKTGDLGYLDSDGCLYITGRQKEIIKVAGERISPAEIEAVVASHPEVADAAVVGAPDPLLGETVWAYVVPRPGGQGMSGLPAYCAARLSSHKVPRRFIEVERIPRTPTGKIRRHLLTGNP